MLQLKDNIVFGLVGRHTSGKTTAAKVIRKLSYTYFNASILDISGGKIVADELAKVTGGSVEKIVSNKVTAFGRAVYEAAGKWLQDDHENIFGSSLLEPLNDATKRIIIIDGIRRPIEGKFIKDHFNGSFLIRIRRDPTPETLPTEIDIDKVVYDYLIFNDNTLLRFEKEVADVFNQILFSPKLESLTEVEP